LPEWVGARAVVLTEYLKVTGDFNPNSGIITPHKLQPFFGRLLEQVFGPNLGDTLVMPTRAGDQRLLYSLTR
jgi:hypothetical protein